MGEEGVERDWMMKAEESAAQFFEECIKKLELKEGDVLLVDARTVDVDRLSKHPFPPGTPNVAVIPLVPEAGQCLDDAVKRIPKDLVRRYLEWALKE